MGLLIDFINKFKKSKNDTNYAKILNGYTPIFSQFGQDIYASDVVQQAVSCIVMELKKITPQHIRDNGSDPIPINSDIQRLLEQPNDRMTQSDFLEKVFWQLFLNYNSFIIPTYDIKFDKEGNRYKKYTGLYPVQPAQVDFLQDQSGDLFVKLRFANTYETTLRYSDVIHIKYRYSVNEFMGGNQSGQPDNHALLETLELNKTLLSGVAKALKSSFAINGVIKYNTLMDDGKMDKNIKAIETHLKNNESGFLPLDIKGEFIPLQNKIQLVDEATLKFIDGKILRHFGVPLAILTGDYTKAQYEAFYQKTLEPLIISISQAFTMTLFSDREKGFGNKIKFYPHELIFMDTQQKIQLFDILVDSAACYKNEMRVAFGMKPLAELVGEIAMSSNKTNAENNKVGENKEQNQPIKDEEDEKRANPYHDPKTGKFTSKPGGGSGLYGGTSGRNYGQADTGDALAEINNGKSNSLKKYLDKDGNLKPERAALHKKIIDDYLKDKTPPTGQPQMRMMGGGPASGKSSVIKSGFVKEFDKQHSVVVDPDDIKQKLPGFNELSKKDTGAASFYHEESSMLAKQLANVSFDEGFNVTYDGTGDGSINSVMKKINGARDKGYKVSAAYVTIDTDEAVKRNKARYDHAKANGENPRLVPESYVRSCHSKVTDIALECSDEFDVIELYDNNGAIGSTKLIGIGGNGKKLTAVPGEEVAFESFVQKGTKKS